MSNIIQQLEKEQMTREVPDFKPGDTVVVQVKVKEGERERVQAAAAAGFERAGAAARGAVLASDAFFPSGDIVGLAARHGIAAIAEPGGSLRDEESIGAARKGDPGLYFTGIRHFRH